MFFLFKLLIHCYSCEIVASMTYTILLYVQRLRSQRENRIEIRFRTEADTGVLLAQSKSPNIRDDYLVMAVIGGRVEVSYNLGKQGSRRLFVLKSPTLVHDGQWHVALLDR